MVFTTIIAPNYWPQVRVLAESIRLHHPRESLVVLIIDDGGHLPADPPAGCSLLRPVDLGLSIAELHALATIYDVTELATALKPRLISTLLPDVGTVIYLDPDIQVFGALDEAIEMTRDHPMVLTPHSLVPMPRDGRQPDEYAVLRSGIYNLGFLGAGPRSHDFLAWWEERLKRDCIVALDDGLFVDQRWVDMASVYFPPAIIRDDTYNVAYWNLDSRKVTGGNGSYEVNGRPLTFFHFSGFDLRNPGSLSRHVNEPHRIEIESDPALRSLCADYADALARQAGESGSPGPYAFGHSSDGSPLTRQVRRLFRRDLISRSERSELPDAFDPAQRREFSLWRLRALEDDALARWRSGPNRRPTLGSLPSTAQRYLWRARQRARSSMRR